MNYALLAINYSLMIALPIIVAIVIRRKTGAPWRLFFIGAVTFILSQVLHIPFNAAVGAAGLLPEDTTAWSRLLLLAVFAGLSAGVFEEVARYLAYRFWARDARSWSHGLMLGAGHGGIEAILLGALAVVNFVALLVTVNNETVMSALPADQRQLITDALAQITGAPAGTLLLGALERVFAIIAHLALSILVLQVFLRRSILWLFLAIAYHAVLDAAAVIAVNRVGPYATEAIVGAIALFGLFLIFRLRTPEPVTAEPEPLPPPLAADALAISPSDEALDRSRYHE